MTSSIQYIPLPLYGHILTFSLFKMLNFLSSSYPCISTLAPSLRQNIHTSHPSSHQHPVSVSPRGDKIPHFTPPTQLV